MNLHARLLRLLQVQVGAKWEFPVAQVKTGMYWGTIEESRGGKRVLSFRFLPKTMQLLCTYST